VTINSNESTNRSADHEPFVIDGPLQNLAPASLYAICVAIVLIFFAADVVLPRGATAAIGYCLIPVVAASSRPGFLLGMTILCTLLTAAGYFTESTGASAWMSVFDRAMVTGVLWLTFSLVRRRAVYIDALVKLAQRLRETSGELHRSNADLERFATVVAHDLRGPLNSVGLIAELLAQSAPVKGDPECLTDVGSIKSELSRMSNFIQSLLTYGRAGSRDTLLKECDSAAVLKDVCTQLKADIARSGVQIIAQPLPVLRADRMLLAELFQNLIENSIKYHSDAPPTVHIQAVHDNDQWRFTFRDNGIGIHCDHCERIFEPFSQDSDRPADQRVTTADGIGLGLATCKRIVARHGGRIWAESNLGEGATFHFTIPDHPLTTHSSNLAQQSATA